VYDVSVDILKSMGRILILIIFGGGALIFLRKAPQIKGPDNWKKFKYHEVSQKN